MILFIIYFFTQMVKGAGHHVYADRADQFNYMVNKVSALADLKIDLTGMTPSAAYKLLRRMTDFPSMNERRFSECTLEQINQAAASVSAAAAGGRGSSMSSSMSMGVIEDSEEMASRYHKAGQQQQNVIEEESDIDEKEYEAVDVERAKFSVGNEDSETEDDPTSPKQ